MTDDKNKIDDASYLRDLIKRLNFTMKPSQGIDSYDLSRLEQIALKLEIEGMFE